VRENRLEWLGGRERSDSRLSEVREVGSGDDGNRGQDGRHLYEHSFK
jgi:hypothetical protein